MALRCREPGEDAGSTTYLSVPCRQYARDHCLRLAEQAVRLAAIPGSQVSPDQAARAAARYRNLATRFSGQA